MHFGRSSGEMERSMDSLWRRHCFLPLGCGSYRSEDAGEAFSDDLLLGPTAAVGVHEMEFLYFKRLFGHMHEWHFLSYLTQWDRGQAKFSAKLQELDANGEFVEGHGRYQESGTYRIVTNEGILGLSPYLRGKLIEKLLELDEQARKNG